MAGRGRGRGRAQLSFPVEAVGIGKGENLPPSTVQPTPLFPSSSTVKSKGTKENEAVMHAELQGCTIGIKTPLEHKPVPLQTGEEAEYMLALKQEFRGAMKSLPFFIRPAAPKKDVERYSDKYQNTEPSDNTIEWSPDWKRLPKELRVRVKRPPSERSLAISKSSKEPQVDKEIIRKLETLEKKEEEVSSGEEEGEKKKTEEEEAEVEEEYDEEEFEEETDYIMSYFDNGEDFGADSDDNMDEAVY